MPLPRTARRRQKGESVVEGMISIMLICLVLFGLLQIFQLCVADMLSRYAAFKTARAATVGFKDYVAERITQTSLAGASGSMLVPTSSYAGEDGKSSLVVQAEHEIFPIPALRGTTAAGLLSSYQSGISWLDYEYWRTSGNKTGTSATSSSSVSSGSDLASGSGGFDNYPLNIPMSKAFVDDGSIDMQRSASLMNAAENYMDF